MPEKFSNFNLALLSSEAVQTEPESNESINYAAIHERFSSYVEISMTFLDFN